MSCHDPLDCVYGAYLTEDECRRFGLDPFDIAHTPITPSNPLGLPEDDT